MKKTQRLRSPLLITVFLGLTHAQLILAAPITYEISGGVALGDVGGGVPSSFVSAIDPDFFGQWTGSLTYDVDTTAFSENIITPEGVAGKDYGGGITAASIEFNNGTSLSSSGGYVTVYTGDVFYLPVGYGVGFGFELPDTFWLTGSPPAEYVSLLSGGRLAIGGEESVTTALGLPPQTLDNASISIFGMVCGDFNGNGVSSNECLEFNSSASSIPGSIAPVPVPAAVWLFGSGLIGLVGLATRKKA